MGQKATDPTDSPPLKFQAPENIALLNSPASPYFRGVHTLQTCLTISIKNDSINL